MPRLLNGPFERLADTLTVPGSEADAKPQARVDGTGDRSYPMNAEVTSVTQSDPDSTPGSGGPAEDDADNQVVGPLLDFIERNRQ